MPQLFGIDIVHEDEDVLVIYKPAGLAVQTRRLGEKDAESVLKNYRVQKKEPPYIGVVHRLDQPVEGVMVFAKNKETAAALSKQVQRRELGKYYLAVCGMEEGRELSDRGTMSDHLVWDAKKNLGAIADANDPHAKKAELDYEILARQGDILLLKIRLHTGRHHQIRLQLSGRGCPIVGDAKYGRDAARRGVFPALCSDRLEFVHPKSGRMEVFDIQPKNPAFAQFSLFGEDGETEYRQE